MDTQEVWASAFGREPLLLLRLLPLFHCLIYYAFVVIAHVLLFKLNTIFSPKWLHSYLGDFLCTITACTISYQHSILRHYYGPIAYVITAVLMTLLLRQVFQNSVPTVTSNVQRYICGLFPFGSLVLRVVMQILAIPATVTVLRLICSLELMPEHVERKYQQSCTTDLNVAVILGFFIEGGATMFDTWLNRIEITQWPLFDSGFKAFANPLMVVAGLSLTGMYMNPILASIIGFGCKGITPSQHVLVYWLAPIVGCIFGQKLAVFCNEQKKLWMPAASKLQKEKQRKNDSPERSRKFRRLRSRGSMSKKRWPTIKYWTQKKEKNFLDFRPPYNMDHLLTNFCNIYSEDLAQYWSLFSEQAAKPIAI